jgi:hypothetical protein
MGKKTRSKLEEKEQKEKGIEEILKKRRQTKLEKEEAKKKKHDGNYWVRKIPYLEKNTDMFIRPVDSWRSPSYNENRQIISFVNWVLCKYRVPKFLFNIFLPEFKSPKNRDYEINIDLFFDWFVTIARGHSFRKITKDIFSKKEAHTFLIGKYDTIGQNIWFAKVFTKGFKNLSVAHYLVNRLFEMKLYFGNLYWNKVLEFYKNFEENLDIDIISETLDFLVYHSADRIDLKGRTLASLIRLSNEWHLEQSKLKGVKYMVKWEPLPVENWTHEDKGGTITTVKQLISNVQLVKEGNRQHNCVSAYSYRCQRGDIGIFSMYSGPTGNRITIEVTNQGQIIQARLKWNRIPKGIDAQLLYKWAVDNVLIVKHF